MDNSVCEDTELPSNSRLLLNALAVATIFVLLLCFLFVPRWETNDDVGMSMAAHGYGIAAVGTPNLIFSNVLWGHLVRLLPEVNGVLGYSIATISVLVFVGTALIYGIWRLGLGYIGTLSALVLILVRPVLFPQFTINAGLLMIGAIICWHLFERQNDKRVLVTGCFFAFFSYLIRSQEFLLVLIVALPLLPWRTLRLHRAPKIAVLSLASAIAISAVIDHQAYQGDEWKSFNELNPARAPFTDFGAGGYLKQRPDILARHGYSSNDIDLIGKWFFVDSSIANPGKLTAMLDELGPLPSQGDAWVNAWTGVKNFWHPILLPLVLAALLLAVLRPSWQVAMVWGFSISAIAALGILGRPGVLRVYVPLVSLLVVAPFLVHGTGIRYTAFCGHRLALLVIFVATLFNTSAVVKESKATLAVSEQTNLELREFPTSPVVIWGGVFPFEAAYPVLKQSQAAMTYRLYGLGVFTLAPFSVASEEEELSSMTDLLVGTNGIQIIANEQRFDYLHTYCKERLHGELIELSNKQYGRVQVSRRRCEVVL